MALESSEPELFRVHETTSGSFKPNVQSVRSIGRPPSSQASAVLQLVQEFASSQLQVPPMLESLTTTNTTTTTTTNSSNHLTTATTNSSSTSVNLTTNGNGGSSNHLLLLLFAILVLINLIVILGNILVIVAVYASAKLRNVTNIFIVSLATADLLLGVLVLPYALVYEVLDVWIFGQIWCRGWLVTDVWISTASILNLCAISIDRYVAVTRPVKYRSIMTNRRAKTIVMIVWLLSFIICFPPLLTEWRPSGGGSDKSVIEAPDLEGPRLPVPDAPEQLKQVAPVAGHNNYPRRKRAATRELIEANESGSKTRRRQKTLKRRPRREVIERRGQLSHEDNDLFWRLDGAPRGLASSTGAAHFDQRAAWPDGSGGIIANETSFWKLSLEIGPQSPGSPVSLRRPANAIAENVVAVAAGPKSGDIPRCRRQQEALDIISSGRCHLLVERNNVASLANLRRAYGNLLGDPPRRPEPLGRRWRRPERVLQETNELIELRVVIQLRGCGRMGANGQSAREEEMIRFPFGNNFIVLNGRLCWPQPPNATVATTTATATGPFEREKGFGRNDEQDDDGDDDDDHVAHKSSPCRVLLYLEQCCRENTAGALESASKSTSGPERDRDHLSEWAAERMRTGDKRRHPPPPPPSAAASKQIPAPNYRWRSLNGLATGDIIVDGGQNSSVIDDRLAARHPPPQDHSSNPVDREHGEPGASSAPPLSQAAGKTSQFFLGQRRRRRRQLETERRRGETKSFNHLTVSCTVHVNPNVGRSRAKASNELRSSGSSSSSSPSSSPSLPLLGKLSGRSGGETKGEGARATQEAEIIGAAKSNQIVVVCASAAGRQRRRQQHKFEQKQFGAHDQSRRRTSLSATERAQAANCALESERRRKPKKDFISNRKNRGRPAAAPASKLENKGELWPSETPEQICARLVLVEAHGAAAAAARGNRAASEAASSTSSTAFIIIISDDDCSLALQQLPPSSPTTTGGGDRISLVSQANEIGSGGGEASGEAREIKSISAPAPQSRGIRAAPSGGGGGGHWKRSSTGQGRAGPAWAAAISGGAARNGRHRNEQMAGRLMPRATNNNQRRSLAANDPRTAARAVGSSSPSLLAGEKSAQLRHNEAAAAAAARGPMMMQNGQDDDDGQQAAWPRLSRAITTMSQTMGELGAKVAYLTNDLLPVARAIQANKEGTTEQHGDTDDQFKSSLFGRAPGLEHHGGRVNKQEEDDDDEKVPRRHARSQRTTIERDINVESHEPERKDLNSSSSSCALFHDKTYVIYSALGSFYIPMLVMVFFYSRIYLVASRAQKAMQRGYMTTKWPPMQTGGGLAGVGKLRSQNGTSETGSGGGGGGVKRWTRSSFKQTSVNLINGGATRRRAQEGMRGPASDLQEGGRSQRPSGDSRSSHQADNESNCSEIAPDQIRENSPERVTLRIHRRTEPVVQSQATPAGLLASLAISQQQQLINSYQSFEVNTRAPTQQARQQAAAASAGRKPLVVGKSMSSESQQQQQQQQEMQRQQKQQQYEDKSFLMRLVSLEQLKMLANSSQRRTRFSLDRGVHLPRRIFAFSGKKRASLPPAMGVTPDEAPSRVPSPLARESKLTATGARQQEVLAQIAGESDNENVVGGRETGGEVVATRAEDEFVVSPELKNHEHHHHRHHRHHRKSNPKKTINTCRKCGRERLKVGDHLKQRPVAGRRPRGEIGGRSKGAIVGGRSDRSNSYGPMPTIIVVSWRQDKDDDDNDNGQNGNLPQHSASATSHLFKCQADAAAAAQVSMPALPLVDSQPDEQQPMLGDVSTLKSSEQQEGACDERKRRCKHRHRHHHCRHSRSSHMGSGLSLVANLPQQVRKQSIALLSSLTTRSSETFRRLSMAAAHPLDALMQTTGNKSSRPSSRATEPGVVPSSSECSDCSMSDAINSRSSSFSSAADSNNEDDDDDDEGAKTTEQYADDDGSTRKMRRKRQHNGPPAIPTSPKRTLDDYLMAVAGIDTSSSDEDNQPEDDSEDDDDEDDEANESDNSSSSSSTAGGLTSMLRKENLMMIPSIQVVSPDDEDTSQQNRNPASLAEPVQQALNESSNKATTTTPGQSRTPSPRPASGASTKSARADSGGGRADDLDSVDKKVKRIERLPPSAGLHRQGGLYESATSQRQSIVSSVADIGEFNLSSAGASINLNSDGAPLPQTTEVNKTMRHSPDLFRLLDVRSKRNKPPPLSLATGATRQQPNGQLMVVSTATPSNGSQQQVVRTHVVTSGRRRGAKSTSRWHAKRLRAETKAAKTVAIIVGGFIFCWLPFFTAYLSRAIICSSPDCIPQTWLSLSIWLGYMNSAINPVIYGLFSADFRHAFKNIVCRCRFRVPASVHRNNHLNHHNYYHKTHYNQHNIGQRQHTLNNAPVVSALVGNTLKSIM